MSIFGGTGFLGLGGTGFGNFATKIAKTAEDVLDFTAKLPNEVLDIGEGLGKTIFGKARDASGGQTAQEFEKQGQRFYARTSGAQAGDFISQNMPLILIGVGALLLVVLTRK